MTREGLAETEDLFKRMEREKNEISTQLKNLEKKKESLEKELRIVCEETRKLTSTEKEWCLKMKELREKKL